MRNRLLVFVWGILAIGWGVGIWVSGGYQYGKGSGATLVTAEVHPGIFWGGIATALILGAFVLCILWFRIFPVKADRAHRPAIGGGDAIKGRKMPKIWGAVSYAGFGLFVVTLLLSAYLDSKGQRHRAAISVRVAPIILGLTMLAGIYINWKYVGFFLTGDSDQETKKGSLNYRLGMAFMTLVACGTILFGVTSLLSKAGRAAETSW